MDEVAEQAVERPPAIELVEDQANRGLDLLVGVDLEGARRASDIADRRQAVELAPPRLVPLAAIHAILEDMKLRLAHDAGQAEQEPVVVVGRVVEAIGVGQERAESRAQLQELMPVLAGPGQSAHLQAEDQADAVERELGQESLESRASLGRLAALAEIVVDDDHLIARPSQLDGTVGEGVLPRGGFAMVEDLLGRGLPDVDDRDSCQVPVLKLGRAVLGRGVIHGRLPADRPAGAGPSPARGAGAVAGDAAPGACSRAR